jgi:hypothetical protein
MNNLQLGTSIFIFIWTSLTTTFSAYNQINSERNIIIMGKIGNDKISLDHRKILYYNDWVPLMKGLIVRSFIFCVLIFFMPFMAQKEDRKIVWLITLVTFLIPLMTLIGSVVDYYQESEMILRYLRENSNTINYISK